MDIYLKQAKMSVVDMRAVDTMEGLTCTAMFSRGPSPRPEVRMNTLSLGYKRQAIRDKI